MMAKTPEEIAAWIAERKKKWPTDKNIQEKEEERLKELDKVEDFFKKQIKSDLLKNNHNSNLLTSDHSAENTNNIWKKKYLESSLRDLDSCKYFLERKHNHENNHMFKYDNNKFTKKHKKYLSNLGKNNIWRFRKSLYTKAIDFLILFYSLQFLVIKHLVEVYNIK
ncbi:hypothetical protein PCK2_000831 [Pneumocystis canis]|nr:hypothetical protein PCK2_000831 [Pneumocystis canis]